MKPVSMNSIQWNQAVGVARHACARIFRDGGAPEDAILAFGLPAQSKPDDWARAVEQIALSLCTRGSFRRAA